MGKYIISDGNARETTDDWDEVIRITESWYEYIADTPEAYWTGDPEDIPENPEYDAEERDVETLNMQIRAYENLLANIQDEHNSYNLTVEVEEVA
jgi:hypothetical protein